jgi:hypothetical protein
VEGWEGKPKGLLQVLLEHRWIDNCWKGKKNTMMERKNEYNIIQLETLLKQLMSSCTDFEEEDTMLQSVASKMHVTVN